MQKSKTILILEKNNTKKITGHLFSGFIPHNCLERLKMPSETYPGTLSIANESFPSKGVKLFLNKVKSPIHLLMFVYRFLFFRFKLPFQCIIVTFITIMYFISMYNSKSITINIMTREDFPITNFSKQLNNPINRIEVQARCLYLYRKLFSFNFEWFIINKLF